MIYFDEIAHRYWDDDTTKYTSTTTFLKKIEEPFDSDYWTSYKAVEKVLKVRNQALWYRLKSILKEDKSLRLTRITNFIQKSQYKYEMLTEKASFTASWENKATKGKEKGTRIHKYKEEKQFKLLRQAGIDVYEYNSVPNATKNYKQSTPLEDLEFNIWYPEVLLSNKQLKISGTADMLMLSRNLVTGKTVINIDDWKTDKEITIENRYQSYLHPVRHLDDCKYSKYRLQLSMYAYLAMLELGESNCEIGTMQFTHLIELPPILHSQEPPKFEEKVYPFKPLLKEIKDIISVYGNTL